ncbi:hypothetical protein KGS39_003572 [Escherichia coli]|nr:hypothetical protein [Escherichia coli]
MIDLIAEQRQLAKIVHDYASRFPQTAYGDAQLLQGCYDYMDAFKRVMDSSSKNSDGLHLSAIPRVFSVFEMDGTTCSGDS